MAKILVPQLGESVSEATIATWFVKEGDSVTIDQMLCELETDKVTVEVPAKEAGVIASIVAKEGDTVAVGAEIGEISEGVGEASSADKPQAKTSETADQVTLTPIMMPTLGESVTEATISWVKNIGDKVEAGDVLAELETDKVSLEVVAPISGQLVQQDFATEAVVPAGAQLGEMSDAAGAVAHQVAPSSTTSQVSISRDSKDINNAPSAEKLMVENGINANQLSGSGRDGRIMKEDVLNMVNNTPTAQDAPLAPAQPSNAVTSSRNDEPREERVKMTKLRQTIARRLKESQNTAAMLTTYNEVDMTAVMNIRKEYKDIFEKKHGVKLGFMSFFAKACCHALMEIPEVNSEIDGTDIIYKNFVHMGVAVGTPNGLVVPVVRDADSKSFAEIEKEIADYGRRARDGKLSMAEMTGGSFTMSNGGVYGSLMSSPILNPPQSGILGMHKIQDRVVVENGEMVIRPMMYLALSYDHRVVDGKGAVTFLVRVKEALEDPRRLLMDI